MADGRQAGGGSAVGAVGSMLSDAVLSVAERIVRPSGGADEDRPAAAALPLPAVVVPEPEPPERTSGHGRVIGDVGDMAAAVVGRIAPAVIERLDIDAIIRRVDIDRVLERVDVNKVLARVDVDAVLDRVDPNRLIERVDVDRMVERVDVGSVAREAVEGLDLGEIVRESTIGIGGDVIRDARLQGMRADRGVELGVDRVLGREPRGAVIPAPETAASRAGLLSRLVAGLIDTLVVVLLGLVLLLVVASVRLLWTGGFGLGFTDAVPVRIAAVALLLVYLTYGWGLDGRTVGALLMGLRVLDEDGSDLSYQRAFVRAVLYVVFPLGLLWSAVSRRDASVQDLIVSTVVVHDWGRGTTPGRPARRGEGS